MSEHHPQVAKEDCVLLARELCRSFKARQGLLGPPAIVRAVDHVSFALEKKESLGLVGESGCGKSTLGRMVCGLLQPTAGRIELLGRVLPLAGPKSWAAGKIQMIFQDPASSLNPRLKIIAAVVEPLLALGVCRGEALARAEFILEQVGLPGLGERYPHQFSGGQRQRIAIARALATTPAVIVCDEPVSALDASVQAQVLNLLKDLQARLEPAYLFISHDLAVVGFMCQRIMVMYLGQIVETGGREQLFTHAGHPYTRALLAAMPQGAEIWSERGGREKKAGTAQPIAGELPSPIKPPSGCYFHPRCPIAKAICKKEPPEWTQLGAGWQARCHFAGEA